MAQVKQRPQLAAVVTAIEKYLHPQHIVDRFLDGYGWAGEFHHPPMDLVALYVDQRGNNDLTQERADRHPGMKVYPTIEGALTRGTGKLAVDGVVVVGEHGRYARNEKGQVQFPHYRFFEEITKVYRESGRSVPYFNDKELAYDFNDAKKMVDTSHAMGFPLQGGSSLAVTWRLPSVEFPSGATVTEALSLGYGGMASYDFHGLETIQCMVERRKGGETGVEWMQTYRDAAFWKAYEDGVWSRELMRSAMSRSVTLKPGSPIFTDTLNNTAQMKDLVPYPVAYQYKHRDGLLCTMLLMTGMVRDFNFAAKIEGQAKPFSTQMYLPMPDGRTTLASFFSPLVWQAEQMFLTGKAQYPVERTLLTNGLNVAGLDSELQAKRIATPSLAAIQYQPYPASTFWRS